MFVKTSQILPKAESFPVYVFDVVVVVFNFYWSMVDLQDRKSTRLNSSH